MLGNALHNEGHCSIIYITAANVQASEQVSSLDRISEFESLALALNHAEIVAGICQRLRWDRQSRLGTTRVTEQPAR